MPHIAITMIPGRSKEIKMQLAEKIQDFLAEELKIEKKFISISIEDIPMDKWEEHIKTFPKEIIFK